MKKKILIVLLILTFSSTFSQDVDWYEFDLDSIITVDLPEKEIFELDTVMKGVPIYQMFNYIENSVFIAQKTELEQNDSNENLSSLPYDLKSLNSYYQELSKGIVRTIPYKIDTIVEFKNKELFGYKLKFIDSLNSPVYEIDMFIINKHLYSFIYSNEVAFNQTEKKYFLNSFTIKDNTKINQFMGDSISYKIGYLLGNNIFLILIVGGVITYIVKWKKKSLTTMHKKNAKE